MAKRKEAENAGAVIFLIGLILAIVLGLLSAFIAYEVSMIVLIIFFLIGIIVGFMNVNPLETKDFLLTGTALVIITYFGGEVLGIIPAFSGILKNIGVIFIPAITIIALRELYRIAKD